MHLFSADTIVFSKKTLNFYFDPENMKKTPSKVAHNPKRPRNRNLVPPKSP